MKKETTIKELNLLNDVAFKTILCHKESREMVVDVIHALTGIEKKLLWNATYIGGEEILKKNLKYKKQITDMVIRISDEHQIIIEMNQFKNEKNIFEKNTSYAYSKILGGTKKGSEKYPSILLINIDNFNKFKTKKPIDIFYHLDEEGNKENELYKSIHLILENVGNSGYNVDKEIEKFAKLLKQKTTIKELEHEFKGDRKYMKVIETIKRLLRNPEFEFGNTVEVRHRDQLEGEREAAYSEGQKEGAKTNALETAKSLLALGINTIEQIADVTGLSQQEVNDLKEQ